MKKIVGICSILSCFAVADAQNPTPITNAKSGIKDAIPLETMQPEMSAASQIASNQFDIMQNLREEVRMLRGIVEELSYELQQVKQRQLDDYLDIDRRLGLKNRAFSSNDAGISDNILDSSASLNGEESASQSLEINNSSLEITNTSSTNQLNEYELAVKADYQSASNKLLKQRDIEAATNALKEHLEKFPVSPFTANAHYWLGEIYLLKGKVELARQAFSIIVDQFPQHPKAMDSNFKLGKIYFQLGERQKAKVLLDAAAASSGGVASKAKNFLSDNF
jgi:tol-pal system protein YbgF